MPAVCVDFDHTLVHDGEWLPGALRSLKDLRSLGLTIIVYSTKANRPAGREEIAAALAHRGFPESDRLRIEPKPEALIYVDDRGHRFTDWHSAMRAIREACR